MKHAPLSDQDYQRLEDTLQRFAAQGAMSLERLDGFFAALLSGPDPLPPEECLPLILGSAFDDEDAFSSPKAIEQFARLVSGHWHDIAHTLQRQRDFAPWLTADAAGEVHGNDWAEGFYDGMQLMHEDWNLLFDDAEAAPALTPILALAFERHPDPEMRPFLDGASREQKDLWLAQIGDAVPRIYQFFAAIRARIAAELEADEK